MSFLGRLWKAITSFKGIQSEFRQKKGIVAESALIASLAAGGGAGAGAAGMSGAMATLYGLLGGAGIGAMGGLMGGDGLSTGDKNFNRDWTAAFNKMRMDQQKAQLPFLQDYYSQSQQNLPVAFDQILQQIQGMPPELQEQMWQYGKRGIAEGYGKAGTGLGEALAGQGTLQSGIAPQAWLNKVGLPQAQAYSDLGLQQTLQNFQQKNLGVGNLMSMLGQTPQVGAGGLNTLAMSQQQQQPVDWSSLGSMFAKGIGGLGQQPGTQPGAQSGADKYRYEL